MPPQWKPGPGWCILVQFTKAKVITEILKTLMWSFTFSCSAINNLKITFGCQLKWEFFREVLRELPKLLSENADFSGCYRWEYLYNPSRFHCTNEYSKYNKNRSIGEKSAPFGAKNHAK